MGSSPINGFVLYVINFGLEITCEVQNNIYIHQQDVPTQHNMGQCPEWQRGRTVNPLA